MRNRACLVIPASGAGASEAVAAGDAAKAETAPPLVVEHAADATTATLEVNGQKVNAVVLDPLTPEDAEVAAGRQLIAPR